MRLKPALTKGKMMDVLIKEYQTEVLNGDRATRKTEYSFFEVWFNGQLLKKFTGFDPAWQMYTPKNKLKQEALSFAKKLGEDIYYEVFTEEITVKFVQTVEPYKLEERV